MCKKLYAFDTPIEVFYKLHEPVIVYWKNKNSVIHGCNDLLAEIAGMNIVEMAGKTDYDYLDETSAKNVRANDQEVLKQKITKSFFEAVKCGNSEKSVIAISLKTLLRNSSNHIVGTLGLSFMLKENYLSQTARLMNRLNLGQTAPFPLVLLPSAEQSKLTLKEREILYYLAKSKSMKEIANILGNSPRTIETHIERIKQKLNCHTRSQLLDKLFEEGLIA